MAYADPQKRLEASRRWKERNREHCREYGRRHYADNQQYYADKGARRRAEKADEIRDYRRRLYVERQQAGNTQTVTEWRRRNPGKHSEIEARRRARKLNAYVEPVDIAEIRARDGGMCGICGEPVAPEHESIDHIVPLARGGEHSRANVQLAHRVCNSRKGAKLP